MLVRLFLYDNAELHIRDLVRATGFSPRSMTKEVDRLVHAGFLLERRSSNRRYVRANKENPLFRPVREILEKTVGIAPLLKAALAAERRIELALLFGSAATGAEKPESDIDLLVVGSVSLSRINEITRPLQQKFGREICPIVMATAEFRQRLAEKEYFVSSVVDGAKVNLLGSLDEFV